MPAKPMLDDVELQQVQRIESQEDEVVQEHSVPALEGDFLQDLGRRSTRIDLTGVLTGPDAAQGLKKLREKFQKIEPVPFVSDITTATAVDKVLIKQMDVEELAGNPQRFEYAVSLLEYVPPPKPETEPPPPPPPPPPKVETGTLVVEVTVPGQLGFDFTTVTVTAEGTKDDGTSLSRTMTNRQDNVWTDEDAPLGSFTVKAMVTAPPSMSGTAAAKIQAGQTAKVNIPLSAGGLLATEFVVHFRFDKAFVEPCMRQVLKQAMQFAKDHDDQKLLIVGHTDLVGTPGSPTGPDPYNQSLSERRARAVYAYLIFGRDQAATDAAVAEWNELRQSQKRPSPTLADNWGTREYQHMLQDLGFYPGQVDGKEGKITQEAVRAFRCQSGLPPGKTMDDAAWNRLIRAYLGQDNFGLSDDRFLRNCGTEPLKWTACASQDPVKNVRVAHRPNRRVELLFTTDSKLPCEIPKPDTFDLPSSGVVGSDWCVGPGDKSKRACFVVPHLPKDAKPKDKEWTRIPAEPGTIEVQVSIKKEIKKDDGTVELKAVSSQKFVVITSDGQFLKSEQGSGEPSPDITKSDGTKTYSDEFPGIYSLEVVTPENKPVLIQLEGDPGAKAKGNAVCKHLTAADNSLNVVMLLDPVLRQVQLPATAHLMTALNPTTRQVRICPVVGSPGKTFLQKTERDEAKVRQIFDLANEVWRQGRVRFDPVDVVEESFSQRTECDVTDEEFKALLDHCAYPNTANVFFFADLEGTGEAGKGVSMEAAAVDNFPGGCEVGDRFELTFGGLTFDQKIDEPASRQVLAHELGHFLTLEHAADNSANGKRLMLPGTSPSGGNTLLVFDEITQARASQGAAFECVPLTLKVTGATQIGGKRSHEFILIQDPAKIVTVEAVISDELLAQGSVTMTGGTAGANDRQRTVSGATAGAPVEIVATYTPTSGGDVITTRVVIMVVTFELRVEVDGNPRPRGTAKLTVARAPGKLVTVIADLQPSPFCVLKTLVTWKGGDEAPDPVRRTVSMDPVAETTVSATLTGITRSLIITVIEVVFTDNVAPFDKAIDTVQIEGILNKDRDSFDVADLFGTQTNSLFRGRADFPGIVGDQIQGKLVSNLPDTTIVETRDIALKRTTGNRFVSLPILAIPLAIPRSDVTMKNPAQPDIEIILATAHGKLRLQVPGNIPGPGVAVANVRGRVVHVAAQSFVGSRATNASIQRQMDRAARTWAQAGIEVQKRSITVSVPAPAGLLDLDQNVPFNGKLTGDEKKLVGITPGGPSRSAVANDLNVYYVDSITGNVLGVTMVHEGFTEISDPGQSAIALEGHGTTDNVLAHEMGHAMLINWGGQEHDDRSGTSWPNANVMHFEDVADAVDLDRTQTENILISTDPKIHNNPFVLLEP